MTTEDVFTVVRDAVVTVMEVEPGTVTRDSRLVEDLLLMARADSNVFALRREPVAVLWNRHLHHGWCVLDVAVHRRLGGVVEESGE